MWLMTWAYLAFMQLLIIWAENLPREIAWYLPRLQTGWRWIGVALVLLQFALPLLALLQRAVKDRPQRLAAVARAAAAPRSCSTPPGWCCRRWRRTACSAGGWCRCWRSAMGAAAVRRSASGLALASRAPSRGSPMPDAELTAAPHRAGRRPRSPSASSPRCWRGAAACFDAGGLPPGGAAARRAATDLGDSRPDAAERAAARAARLTAPTRRGGCTAAAGSMREAASRTSPIDDRDGAARPTARRRRRRQRAARRSGATTRRTGSAASRRPGQSGLARPTAAGGSPAIARLARRRCSSRVCATTSRRSSGCRSRRRTRSVRASQQRLGAQLPLDCRFTDSDGRRRAAGAPLRPPPGAAGARLLPLPAAVRAADARPARGAARRRPAAQRLPHRPRQHRPRGHAGRRARARREVDLAYADSSTAAGAPAQPLDLQLLTGDAAGAAGADARRRLAATPRRPAPTTPAARFAHPAAWSSSTPDGPRLALPAPASLRCRRAAAGAGRGRRRPHRRARRPARAAVRASRPAARPAQRGGAGCGARAGLAALRCSPLLWLRWRRRGARRRRRRDRRRRRRAVGRLPAAGSRRVDAAPRTSTRCSARCCCCAAPSRSLSPSTIVVFALRYRRGAQRDRSSARRQPALARS